ncbi:maleylpyruvate isomerase family mycothiol-dependent enzyme [Amycolatopsis sp. A1MSW2902]|uniref:maleylpyruvate isomerase family mycothiol-dependent enzyme n=1 Tax=Amycolatopsis sp. A1MSW2902 TaxID=687413 RepID=UPI00307F0EC9
MEISDQLNALQSAGERLAVAAQSAGLGASVPSCPGWTVRDLLFHTSAVHRWAAAAVREARLQPPPNVGGDPLRDAEHRPPDDELVGWFADGHTSLVKTLRDAPADVECWSFLTATSPLSFWVRRQTHETTVHRVDAELAARELTPIDPAVAVDGIDELLTGFAPLTHWNLHSEQARTMSVQTTDVAAAWHLTIGTEPVVSERVDENCGADAALRGTATQVYLALWNRTSFDTPDSAGDAELLGKWPELLRVRWSR